MGSGQASLLSSTVRGYDRCAGELQSTPDLQHLCTVFCGRLLGATADTWAILPAYQHIVGQSTIHPAVLRTGAQGGSAVIIPEQQAAIAAKQRELR